MIQYICIYHKENYALMNNTKLRKRIIKIGFIILQAVLLIAAFLLLDFAEDGSDGWYSGFVVLLVGVIYLFIVSLSCNKFYQIEYYLKDKNIKANETKLFFEFVEKVKACYSYEDFFGCISEILEQKANCSVSYINCEKNTVLYASPSNICANEKVYDTIMNNYPVSWNEGYFFFGKDMSRSSFAETARGFFLSYKGYHFFVFCRYTRLLNTDIFEMLFDEFRRFQERMITMNKLTEMERITHDWHHLDDIKKSYMKVPEDSLKSISISAYCNPNLDETGSFTTSIPLNDDELLVVIGDDNIKGLSSLLNMSVILNTIRIAADKHNMILLTKLIHQALEDVNLKNENLTLFIGIVNSKEHKITYVNYGMRTAVVIDGETESVERLPAVCTIFEDTKKINLSPVTQTIPAKNVILLTSNHELCQKPEVIRTAVFNIESSTKNLIDAVYETIEYENAKQSRNCTLVAVKVEE